MLRDTEVEFRAIKERVSNNGTNCFEKVVRILHPRRDIQKCGEGILSSDTTELLQLCPSHSRRERSQEHPCGVKGQKGPRAEVSHGPGGQKCWLLPEPWYPQFHFRCQVWYSFTSPTGQNLQVQKFQDPKVLNSEVL